LSNHAASEALKDQAAALKHSMIRLLRLSLKYICIRRHCPVKAGLIFASVGDGWQRPVSYPHLAPPAGKGLFRIRILRRRLA